MLEKSVKINRKQCNKIATDNIYLKHVRKYNIISKRGQLQKNHVREQMFDVLYSLLLSMHRWKYASTTIQLLMVRADGIDMSTIQ